MTHDEIVNALKLCAGDRCCEGCIEEQSVRHWQIVMREAAGLIESLRAEVDESQRREQAAVEDLKRFSACCQCNANIDGSCCDMFDGTAENKYFCSNWQWRGPQEAGKGAAE